MHLKRVWKISLGLDVKELYRETLFFVDFHTGYTWYKWEKDKDYWKAFEIVQETYIEIWSLIPSSENGHLRKSWESILISLSIGEERKEG